MVRFHLKGSKLYRSAYGQKCVLHHEKWREVDSIPTEATSISEKSARAIHADLHGPACAWDDQPVTRPKTVSVSFNTYADTVPDAMKWEIANEEVEAPKPKKAKKKRAKKKAKRKASKKKGGKK